MQSLHPFNFSDGAACSAPLTRASNGLYYGTTFYGGTGQYGTVFEISPAGAFRTIYNFSAPDSSQHNVDGHSPTSGLVMGPDGALYGCASAGGTNGTGTVFRVTIGGAFTVLHTFSADGPTGNADGAVPVGALVQGHDGAYYGVTSSGGTSDGGTAFRVTSSGQFTSLVSFSGVNGSVLRSGLILADDFNFYGVTSYGGAYDGGTIFRMTPQGDVTVLYSFSPPNSSGTNLSGATPSARLTVGYDGNFYGTTTAGGSAGHGTWFRFTRSGVLMTLLSISNAIAGQSPSYSELTLGAEGRFYGVSTGAGTANSGLLYIISPGGVLNPVFSFSGTSGTHPYGSPIQTPDGDFLGTTSDGGANGNGTIYRLHSVDTRPVLGRVGPQAVAASSAGFTMTLRGAYFSPQSVAEWDGTPLTTSYVSPIELRALVPAADLTAPRTATVTVQNPGAGNTSNGLPFLVEPTQLDLQLGTIVRSSGNILSVALTITNTGGTAAKSVFLRNAVLGALRATSALPVSLGDIAAGSKVSVSVTFPGTAGIAGEHTHTRLAVSGVYTNGTFSATSSAVLP